MKKALILALAMIMGMNTALPCFDPMEILDVSYEDLKKIDDDTYLVSPEQLDQEWEHMTALVEDMKFFSQVYLGVASLIGLVGIGSGAISGALLVEAYRPFDAKLNSLLATFAGGLSVLSFAQLYKDFDLASIRYQVRILLKNKEVLKKLKFRDDVLKEAHSKARSKDADVPCEL